MAAEYGMSPVVGPVHIPEDQRQAGESADLLRRAVRALLESVAAAQLEHETLDAGELAALREALAAA